MVDTSKSAFRFGRNPKSAIAIALVALPLIYFYPVLLGQVFLAPGDGWAQNFPLRALAGQMIADGQLPLWNPYIFGGMPLAASVYPGAFYPPNWLFAVLPPVWAMNLVVITTYHLALIGAYLYARRIGITRLGALLAGVAFAFGGFMINHLSHTSRIGAAAWLPWVLLAIENITRSASWRTAWRWAALGAAFIALQFVAGEPQMVAFTVLVCAPCTLFALKNCADRTARFRSLMALAVMIVCGVLMCLPQLLPSLELLAQSERNDPGPLFFDSYSFPPKQLPSLIFPYFFGGGMLPPFRLPNWGDAYPAQMAGYVGLLTWLFALIGLLSFRLTAKADETSEAADTRRRMWLWLGIAATVMILAFGGYLPFELNHLLYRVPGYKAFRGSYRHTFEFTFALGVLGGLGATRLSLLAEEFKRRAMMLGTLALALTVAIVAVLYRFFGPSLASANPRAANAAALTNPEFLVPIGCFVVSVAALWLSQSQKLSVGWKHALLVGVLLLDVAAYGHFFQWRLVTANTTERLADPPAVQFIKSREKDLNSFRVMSHLTMPGDYTLFWPEDPNFETVNQPNISLMRGLQSVSGYDVLRPLRVGEITGTAGSVLNGYVQDTKSFGLEDRGLDLLNVKYLLVGHGGATGKKTGVEFDGMYFARTYFGAELKPGSKLTTTAGNTMATEIAVVSNMANSTHLPDGAPILKLRLHTRDGRVIERTLEAGRDTSEWAYDRADVKAAIKHQRARVFEDFDAGEFKSHGYLGRLKFDRAEIEKIEWIYLREDASLLLLRATLFDATTGKSEPLANFYLPSERWHSLGRFDQVEVYENLRVLPRVWITWSLIKTKPGEEILKAIRNAPDEKSFSDLKEFALTEEPTSAVPSTDFFDCKAEIKTYAPHRIEIEKQGISNGFLVLSEVFYDGWEARVDGQPTKIYRTNYTLRGVVVPPGEHRIEFVYRPRSFRLGLWGLVSGVAVLVIGWIRGLF
ncbi:MAG: DUF6044 family protein [Acidobacteriota bacterium]|nr:DUF6044 family protein [Acidobacteriota bacterium]